ncbi:hypothetical protein CYY_008302 [Polysphondylium violaceum]|uniref:Transmembrane protein n=1 Tax=Polysphondylium violaceum TaxID=133409 RepID=A0A8J4PNG6_9MYCE|nr:hypothetical protein CYY_008302 [Polysphondylium violaceum]
MNSTASLPVTTSLPFRTPSGNRNGGGPSNNNNGKGQSLYIGFVSGCLAAIGATTITNPIELVKTRLQLQGQLQMSNKIYNGIGDAFVKIAKNEGILGLQKGLFAAYLSQGTMQGFRFGAYELFIKLLNNKNPDGNYFFLKNLIAGAGAGAVGAAIGSPFDLVKTRMQASTMYANDPQFRGYNSVYSSFKQIITNEGLKGLTRGMATSAQRTGVGSGIQLATYGSTKKVVLKFVDEGAYAHLLSSLVAGFFLTIGMNPFDVARTRLYYQGKGNSNGEMYKGLMDCIYKTTKQEGFMALYKGFGAHYLRVGPHTVLMMIFWEQIKKMLS